MKGDYFSLKDRIKSFRYAWEGLSFAMKKDHNFKIHLVATILAFGLGFYFQLERLEFIAILLVIGMVWMAELINSALETLADVVEPSLNNDIKAVKDLSAAAVLVVAIVALMVGCIVFIPYFIAL